jgi:hypothetical protein
VNQFDSGVEFVARLLVHGLANVGLIRCGLRRPFRRGINGSSLRQLIWEKRDARR